MKSSKQSLSLSVSLNSANRGMKRVYLFGTLLFLAAFVMSSTPAFAGALLTAGPYTAQSNGGYLVNNYNTGAVQTGLAANLGTIFTLANGAQTYNLSQVITYHAHGAPAGGTITIENYRQIPIRTVAAIAVGGVNWVATFNPPLQLPPGIYIVRDSSPSTWSNNSGSAGCLWFNPSFQCGFVRITGSVTMPPPPSYNPRQITSGGGSFVYPVTKNICSSSPIPSGFIVINNFWSALSCGNPTSIVDNVETVEQYSNQPVGAQLLVCAFAPTPTGWAIAGQSYNGAACGQPTGFTYNMKYIRRIN